jgi:hypothetical protein
MGFNDGTAWGMDEYGRQPGNPGYRDQEQHDRDWATHGRAQREWAKKRVGKSVAHIDNTMREDSVEDSLMHDFLAGQGLVPPRQGQEVSGAEQQIGDDGAEQEAGPEEQRVAAVREVNPPRESWGVAQPA